MGVAGRGIVAPPVWRLALERGDLRRISQLAELKGDVSLRDAVRILELLRDDDRYERAAVRWLGRLAMEGRDVDLAALTEATVLLDTLPQQPDVAVPRLRAICQQCCVA